jgi:hypothetical protein
VYGRGSWPPTADNFDAISNGTQRLWWAENRSNTESLWWYNMLINLIWLLDIAGTIKSRTLQSCYGDFLFLGVVALNESLIGQTVNVTITPGTHKGHPQAQQTC